MKRIDFLYALLACSIMICAYANGGEIYAFSASLTMIIFYALLAWAQFEENRLLRISGNFAGDEFNEKYKDLSGT
ncbi:MAG: hypothetical protein COA94_04935 [Rickettsiales bacterium]|nr:MAG: hypothetical protein COA94_04935 [Rickettsiales bacterium]